MARTDYQDDPRAPRANSLVPSAMVAVRDDDGRVLLIHKVDNGYWALPGGAMYLGESIRDAAVREAREETGVGIELDGLVGVLTDPGHVMVYDDGEVRQEFAVCFHAHVVSGRVSENGDEASAARWVDPADIPELPMMVSMRQQVDAALRRDATPVVDQRTPDRSQGAGVWSGTGNRPPGRGVRCGSIQAGGRHQGRPSTIFTVQPPWWTSWWWNRHSNVRFPSSVGPPSSQ